MTVMPPEPASGPRHAAPPRQPRARGVTHLVFTSELPSATGVRAASDGKIILVNSAWSGTARLRALRHELRRAHRYPGLAAVAMLADARIRRLIFNVGDKVSSVAMHAATVGSPDNPVAALVAAATIGTAAATVGGLAAGGVIPVAPFTSGAPAPSGAAQPRPVYAHLRPYPASYLGAYEATSPNSYAGMTQFAQTIGHKPNLALYYVGWGESFHTAFAEAAAAAGAVPVVQLNPYGVTLASIADGSDDGWLIRYAQQIHAWGKNIVISFGHEMNGRWYPWGYGHADPKDFVAAWRHVVDVFRAEGDFNVTWLWTVNREAAGVTSPIAEWYPGSQYVTWVGMDGYYYSAGQTFQGVFGQTLADLRSVAPGKPVLIAETAADPPERPEARQIKGLFRGIRDRQILGFIWFDEPGHTGLRWRIEGNPPAIAAFRLAAKGY